MNEEDEAFNDIERQANQRKESVKANFLSLSLHRSSMTNYAMVLLMKLLERLRS